ncbi:MAG: histidine triad nucleotide-binding protein [Gemmataceae bacterium]
MMEENIFLKIINKEIDANIVHEDEHCLAFHDIQPKAPTHILIIPRKVLTTHDEITEEDKELIGHMHVVAIKVAKEVGLTDGYRLVINCKDEGGQSVPHLHMHLMGGRHMAWPPG